VESKPVPLLKRKQKRSSSQTAQAQHEGAEENRPTPRRVRVVREGQAALASPSYKCEGRDRSSVDREEEEERRGIEDAARQVLGILPGSPVTYKSSEQEEVLYRYALVRGISPLIVVLLTGDGKTLLPVAAAVLDDAAQQESGRPNVPRIVNKQAKPATGSGLT
jgi:hypothetical protein